ncbi:MAG: hypothetical protein ABJD97_01440 [Betaproteobacteria bacterium]
MKLRTLLPLALVALAGCAAGPPPAPFFVDSAATLTPPPADKAQIVFLEPINAIQGAFPTGVYEIRGTERTLLAELASHTKSVQMVAPGHHVYMSSQGGTAHIMEADVVAGKRYYVLMRFIYANGMQLRPIRPTGPSDFAATNKDFAEWVSITRFVDKTAAADAHDQKFAETFAKAQADGLADWQKKTAAQRAELTLNAEDAIAR